MSLITDCPLYQKLFLGVVVYEIGKITKEEIIKLLYGLYILHLSSTYLPQPKNPRTLSICPCSSLHQSLDPILT